MALFAAAMGHATHSTIADGADKKLMLAGHDPVAYFTWGKHVLGNSAIKTEHEGVIYRFASQEHKQMFLNEPDRYSPQFGGFCANGIVYGIPRSADADSWRIIDGKLYMFGGVSERKYFLMDDKTNIQRANFYWVNEIKGRNALLQRYKRLILRVPHYKTHMELATEWDTRQARKS